MKVNGRESITRSSVFHSRVLASIRGIPALPRSAAHESGRRRRSNGFTDVREIQKSLKAKGLSLASEADESTTGPASLMLIDPDGNPVLIDQHVDSPPNSKNKTAGKT